MYFSDDVPGSHPGNGGLAISRITRTTDARRLTLQYTWLEPGKPTYRIETVFDNRTLNPIEQIVSRGDTVHVTLRFRDGDTPYAQRPAYRVLDGECRQRRAYRGHHLLDRQDDARSHTRRRRAPAL